MLVVSRQVGQTMMIGDDLYVTVDEIRPDAAVLIVCGPAATLVGVDQEVTRRSSNSLSVALRREQSLRLAPSITIGVVDLRGDKVRISIEAPIEFPVHRKEVYEALKRENDRRR